MSDHVRKYDWQFVVPTKQVPVDTVGQNNADINSHFATEDKNVAQQIDKTELQQVGQTNTAPVDFNTVNEIRPNQEEYKPTNPFATHDTSVLPTDPTIGDDSGARDKQSIDPDTGLEIPDYMKAFM